MTAQPSIEQPGEKHDITQGILRWMLRVGIFVLILAASLFISSGRLDWGMAWVYVGVLVANQVITALLLIPRNPELLAERAQSKGTRDADRILAAVMALYGPLATLIVAGLSMRFGWPPPIPPVLQIGGLAVVVLGSLLTIWAMASNRFFYGVFRIDQNRGHAVASAGPYRAVRHPGYVGAILFNLATPVLLGSWWALIPAALTVCAIIVRTTLEDGALQGQLDGYPDYAQQVRFRLVPGVW